MTVGLISKHFFDAYFTLGYSLIFFSVFKKSNLIYEYFLLLYYFLQDAPEYVGLLHLEPEADPAGQVLVRLDGVPER